MHCSTEKTYTFTQNDILNLIQDHLLKFDDALVKFDDVQFDIQDSYNEFDGHAPAYIRSVKVTVKGD
jgi:hypothetical protein